MKQLLLSLLAITAITATQAQEFHLGVKGGANINQITGKAFNDQFTFGYHLGGFAEIGLSKKFSIQPEVLFNQISADTTDRFSAVYNNLLNGTVSSNKLNYLSVPILLNYKLSKAFVIQAGPQFGILMDQSKNFLQNGKEAFKSGDFALLAGVQIKLSSFRIYGRYAIGLQNINDIDNKDQWKSQGFQLGVGLAIF